MARPIPSWPMPMPIGLNVKAALHGINIAMMGPIYPLSQAYRKSRIFHIREEQPMRFYNLVHNITCEPKFKEEIMTNMTDYIAKTSNLDLEDWTLFYHGNDFQENLSNISDIQ